MSSMNDATDVHRNASDEEAATTVLSDLFESLESADDIPTWDDGPDASAFIAKPEQELDDLMPKGPFTIRLMGNVYDEVYEDLMLQLLRRGLLAGAEVWNAPGWIPFSEHPDFGAIQAQMAAEVERLVARSKPPRELTPQPHWRSPQNVRRDDEVTRPSVRLSDIEGMEFESEGLDEGTGGGLARGSESFDDTRKTAEFDSEPFRRFAEEVDAPTQSIGGDTIDEAIASVPDSHRTDSEVDSPSGTWNEVPDTEVSEILTLKESDGGKVELPTPSAGDLRVRQRSPLEGNQAPRTTFPVEAGSTGTSDDTNRTQNELSSQRLPGAAIVSRPGRKQESAARVQQPARKKQPTAALPRAGAAHRTGSTKSRADEPQKSSRVPTWIVYIAVVTIVVSLVAIAAVAVRYWSANADASPAAGPMPAETAIGSASATLQSSLPTALGDARDIAEVADSLSDQPAHERMWALSSLHASNPTAEGALAVASASLEAGEFARTKRLAAEAVVLGAEPSVVRPIFSRALQSDPILQRDQAFEWNAINSLSRTDERIVANVEGARWVVIPATTSEPDAYRTMLAYGRLCAVFQCGFDVPMTHHVEISKRALRGAEGAVEALELDSLRWVEKADGDVVDAAAFRLPDKFEAFPIDDEPRWRGWLGVDPLGPEERADLLSLSTGVAPVELVRQLSNLLTLDYLTNNWSRISDAEFATTLLIDGRLVTTWHGAAFATRSSRRVEDRFGWVERFDRHLVAELRLVTPEMIDDYLFVDEGPVSRARRDEFWSQREELLEAVEDAEKEHGDAIWL